MNVDLILLIRFSGTGFVLHVDPFAVLRPGLVFILNEVPLGFWSAFPPVFLISPFYALGFSFSVVFFSNTNAVDVCAMETVSTPKKRRVWVAFSRFFTMLNLVLAN